MLYILVFLVLRCSSMFLPFLPFSVLFQDGHYCSRKNGHPHNNVCESLVRPQRKLSVDHLHWQCLGLPTSQVKFIKVYLPVKFVSAFYYFLLNLLTCRNGQLLHMLSQPFNYFIPWILWHYWHSHHTEYSMILHIVLSIHQRWQCRII